MIVSVHTSRYKHDYNWVQSSYKSISMYNWVDTFIITSIFFTVWPSDREKEEQALLSYILYKGLYNFWETMDATIQNVLWLGGVINPASDTCFFPGNIGRYRKGTVESLKGIERIRNFSTYHGRISILFFGTLLLVTF